MTPYEEAQKIADEIKDSNFESMYVTISWGCEYCNSYDVEADTMPKDMRTTPAKIMAIQKRLNDLGANPKLEEDGLMGKATLEAILKQLNKA